MTYPKLNNHTTACPLSHHPPTKATKPDSKLYNNQPTDTQKQPTDDRPSQPVTAGQAGSQHLFSSSTIIRVQTFVGNQSISGLFNYVNERVNE